MAGSGSDVVFWGLAPGPDHESVPDVTDRLDPAWTQFSSQMTEIHVSDVRIRFPFAGPDVFEKVMARDRRWVRTHEGLEHVSLSWSELDFLAFDDAAT